MGDRELILASMPDPAGGSLPPVFDRSPRAIADLWLEFEERLVALGGQMVPQEMLPLLLQRDAGYHADEDALPYLPDDRHAAMPVWDAEVGVCLGDLAIAETGSIVVAAGPGRSRLTSLAPPVNVVLIREGRIVAHPEDAFTRMPRETTVLITGTSRTADIEGVLVRGVHGPRELYVVRLDSENPKPERGSAFQAESASAFQAEEETL